VSRDRVGTLGTRDSGQHQRDDDDARERSDGGFPRFPLSPGFRGTACPAASTMPESRDSTPHDRARFPANGRRGMGCPSAGRRWTVRARMTAAPTAGTMNGRGMVYGKSSIEEWRRIPPARRRRGPRGADATR
jgi:hypothetical protein